MLKLLCLEAILIGLRNPSLIQTLLLIEFAQKYISFWSNDPQLCFKNPLGDREQADTAPAHLYQRFIFNLHWSPQDFKEVPVAESFVEAGVVGFF